MEAITQTSDPSRTALAYTLGLAILWMGLAVWRPTTTYHLAPVLVAGLAPVAAVSLGALHKIQTMAVIGVLLAATATSALALSGRLEGPSILPFGGAALESFIGVAVGGGLGWAGARLLK